MRTMVVFGMLMVLGGFVTLFAAPTSIQEIEGVLLIGFGH
jgi:hypothetical protein